MLCSLLVGVTGALPARAAAAFNPVFTASLSEDAARRPSTFSLSITQNDGEEQIGDLSLSLPRPGFIVDTDIPGSNGGQVGTIRAVIYTGPTRTRLTLDGTLNDDNDRAGCDPGVRQCIIANIDIPQVGHVAAQLEIDETTGAYTINGDLTGTWADDSVKQIDGRLAELSATLFASASGHTVFQNGDGALRAVTYSLTSASVPSRNLTGGLHPPCGAPCSFGLNVKEYAPTAPAQGGPAYQAAFLAGSPTAFSWLPSTDRNGDSTTYTVVLDGADVPVGTALSYTTPTPLSPGKHTWQVKASDPFLAPTVTAPPWTFTILDPASTITFTSASNSDKLYIDTAQRAFVYEVSSPLVRYGADAGTISPSRGYIALSRGFTLVAAYDTTSLTATGAFTVGNARREFIDPPGA